LKSNEERFSELEKKVKSQLDIDSESLTNLESNFEKMNERLSKFESEMSSRMTKIEKDISRIELHGNSFETKITKSVENISNELKGTDIRLSNELNSIVRKQTQNEVNFISICERVKVIESETNSFGSVFERLKEFSSDVIRLEKELKSIRTDGRTIENEFCQELKVRFESQEIEMR
jgi:uncharacterized protein (UPF0335 family)